jgi:hypothetical protein
MIVSLNRLVTVIPAHLFKALASFTVCFSVLGCWTNGNNMGTKWSSRV